VSDFNPEDLDPGICDIVVALRDSGWNTVDSGDGVTKGELGLPFPHVAITIPDSEFLITESRSLMLWLRGRGLGMWTIEASYNPADDVAIILVLLPDDPSGCGPV